VSSITRGEFRRENADDRPQLFEKLKKDTRLPRLRHCEAPAPKQSRLAALRFWIASLRRNDGIDRVRRYAAFLLSASVAS
jgi:hypothetical protein